MPIVSMAVGQPSDPAPQRVREAAARALADGRIGYTDALGIAGLRAGDRRHYRGPLWDRCSGRRGSR